MKNNYFSNQCVKRGERGFTLVEMSVVLILIGLIITSVLIGRDLIHSAKISKVVSQIGLYNTALSTFQVKYRGLPGDFDKAVAFGLGVSGGAGDDGDGNQYLTSVTTNAENINFWHHLSKSGYVAGAYDGLTSLYGQGAPEMSLSGVGVWAGTITSPRIMNIYILGIDDVDSARYHLTPYEAYQIDLKMDDALPNLGIVVAPSGFEPYCYTSPPNSEYQISSEEKFCALFIRFN